MKCPEPENILTNLIKFQDIVNSSEPKFYEIRQAIADNPIRLVEEDMQFDGTEAWNFSLAQIQKGGWITIFSDEILESTKHDGYCDFVGIKVDFWLSILTYKSPSFQTGFAPKSKHFLMRKNHTLLPAFNKLIVEEGLTIKRLHDKYFKYVTPTCELPKPGPKALGKFFPYVCVQFGQILGILSYYAVLVLLGVGFVFGGFSFVLELWMKNRRK
jgi:hypothetical protein